MSSSFPPNQAREGRTAQAVAPAPGPEKAVRVPDGFEALAKLPGVVIYQRLVTPDGQIRYTYISGGPRELFGVSAEEIISDPKALFSCHSADYSAKFKERLLAASKSLTSWDVEASIVSRDGRKKYTHAIAQPERKPDGSVLWTGVILDETRSRTAFFENLSQGFLLYDAEDRLILRNNHFLEMLPALQDVAVPGAHYSDITRAEIAGDRAASLEDPELFDSELYEMYRQRLEKHADAHSMFERELDRDRWLLVNEHRTEEGTVVLYTDISELKRREREIRHLAYHDVLTNLPNRMLFHERIEEALNRARERNTTAALMCLDLDNFKYVNDTLGHSAGDDLLKCVSTRLRACLRDSDTIARLGGDEFGIVITDLQDAEYATSLAWRLSDAVNQPIDLNGQRVNMSVSIGIATATNGDTTSDRLLKDADLALYRAKAAGRATLQGQARRRRHLPVLRSRDGRARPGAPRAGDGSSSCGRERSARAALSGPGRHPLERDHRLRGVGTLEPAWPGHGFAGPVHPAGRRDRHYHEPRRVGAAQGVQGCRRLAFAGPRRGERFGGPIQGSRPGQARRSRPAGNRIAGRPARAGDHGILAPEGRRREPEHPAGDEKSRVRIFLGGFRHGSPL